MPRCFIRIAAIWSLKNPKLQPQNLMQLRRAIHEWSTNVLLWALTDLEPSIERKNCPERLLKREMYLTQEAQQR